MRRSFLNCIIAVMVFFSVILSCLFISEEIIHDCSGEDCPICAILELCDNTLRRTSGATYLYMAMLLPSVFCVLLIFTGFNERTGNTLVSYKVRMNN